MGGLFDEPRSAWLEVPQARFLSWSAEMQLAYCAARDEDSATYDHEDVWKQFYLQRAETYRKWMKQISPTPSKS